MTGQEARDGLLQEKLGKTKLIRAIQCKTGLPTEVVEVFPD